MPLSIEIDAGTLTSLSVGGLRGALSSDLPVEALLVASPPVTGSLVVEPD